MAFPRDLPQEVIAVSEAQEFADIYVWGFIETREGVPSVFEVYGDLTGELAAMNATERALELGFSPREANDLSSVLRGSDDRGEFEVRQFWIEDVPLNGTHVLFEEANDLADATAELLGALTAQDEIRLTQAVKEARSRLRLYDDRWAIARDERRH